MRSWYGIGDILHWLLDKNSDNCETLRKRELNYGKLTRAKENLGNRRFLEGRNDIFNQVCAFTAQTVRR